MALFQKKEKRPLKELVAQAVANELELRRLQSLDGDLTAQAYIAACENVPGASADEADKIEAALEGHEGPLLRPAWGKMWRAIRHFRRSAPILKLNGYMDHESDAALGRLNASRQSLFLAAARYIVRTQPELFGAMTEANQFGNAIAECLSERARLRVEIEKSVVSADLILEKDRAVFRAAPPIAYCEGFSERLVNFAVSEMAEAA